MTPMYDCLTSHSCRNVAIFYREVTISRGSTVLFSLISSSVFRRPDLLAINSYVHVLAVHTGVTLKKNISKLHVFTMLEENNL